MSCPLWGSGDLWGSGSLWCRQFGSFPYYVEIDYTLNRCAIVLNYAGSGSFMVDRIDPNIDWGRSNQDWTYNADTDVASGSHLSIQLAYSYNSSFICFYINPVVQVKHHQPIG